MMYKGGMTMGLFDNMKKKKEAKNLGLTNEQYEVYEAAQSMGIDIDEFKTYLSSFSSEYNLEQYVVLLRLKKHGFSETICSRYIRELSARIQENDLGDFLDAEKIGLSVDEYMTYSASLKSKMSAVDYVGFLKAQKTGITLGKYLQYLKSFKGEMSIKEYTTYLSAEENGMSQEKYKEYLEKYKDKFTVEQYIEFDKARSLGMTMEEYQLRIEATSANMSLDEFKLHKEAKKLNVSDEEYKYYQKIKESNCIVDGVLTIIKELVPLEKNVFKHLDFNCATFSEELDCIDDEVFAQCVGLKSIVIPSFIKKIGENAFSGCTSLAELIIEEGLTEISDGAFEGCTSLENVFIPGSVSKVGYHAFYGCSSLRSLEFASGVESIDVSDWGDLPTLETVITPASARLIHLNPFKSEDSRSIIINKEKRFKRNNEITTDYITAANYSEYGIDANQATVEYIEVYGDNVFLNLVDFPCLKTVVFSARGCIKSIENCPSLQMILYNNYLSEIPSETVTTQEQREKAIIEAKTASFEGCNAPKLRFLAISDGAIVMDLDHYSGSTLAWLHIPACTSRFRMNSSAITAVAIHGNCKIDNNELSQAISLSKIRFDIDGREDGVYSNINAETIIFAELPACNLISFSFQRKNMTAELMGVQRSVRYVEMPQNLKIISDNTFDGWGIETITIPSTVNSIGNNVFANCSKLRTVVFKGVPQDIGSELFVGCSSLVSIEIAGEKLSVSDFENKYKLKSSLTTTNDEMVMDDEASGKAVDKVQADATIPRENDDKLFDVEGQFRLKLPGNYLYCADKSVIGENRVMVAVIDDAASRFDDPYSAVESMTILEGGAISSLADAEKIATTLGLEHANILFNSDELNVRYIVSESTEEWDIIIALICTQTNSFPIQFFFNGGARSGAEEFVKEILSSIELSNVTDSIIVAENDVVDSISNEVGCVVSTRKNAAKSVEEKLTTITKTLKERYASGERKAYSITELRKQNLDLPVSSIGVWSKKVFGQNASEYLSDQGILSKDELVASMREEKEREEEAKTLEEQLTTETAVPTNTTYYEPPVYYVEEIKVYGEEAEDWECKDTYWRREGQLIIDDYVGDKKHIIVPTYINGRRVMGLGPACFSKCKAETIEIPGTIKELDGTNGYGNEYIKTIVVGEGVQTITDSFMSAAEKLNDVKVSRSVNYTGARFSMDIPFSGTPWFENQEYVIFGDTLVGANSSEAVMHIPSGVRRVCKNMAINMPNLRTIIIPDTVTELCSDAFSNYTSMVQEIVIPDSLIKIGENAFGRTKWIEQQNGKNIIINNVLYKCDTTESDLVIPEGIVSIAGGTFKDNNYIKTISFPSTLREIGAQAFLNCKNITTIELPANIVSLGKACFYGCKNLSKVVIPDSLIDLETNTFYSCSNLTEVTFGEKLSSIGEKAFYDCKILKDIKLGGNVRRIHSEAFSGCSMLSSIELPDTIEEIGREAFENCASLEKITIPRGIHRLNKMTFSGCSKLAQIQLPDSIEEIAQQAFYKCSALEEIFLPKSVGKQAFFGCDKLRKVVFADGMKNIEESCFFGCKELKEVVIPVSVEKIESGAFSGCVSLCNIVLPKMLVEIGESAFKGCESITNIVVPESVEIVGDEAFKDCIALCDVVLPPSCKEFGLDVFTNTPYIKKEFGEFMIVGGTLSKYLGSDKNVVVPDGVTVIGENAFAEAYDVETITIPDSVQAISKKIMGTVYSWDDEQKPQLKKLIVGNGVSSIGEEAFENCQNLKQVIFGNRLATIGARAFSGCGDLEEIDLSHTMVTEVQEEAFNDCYSVKNLKLSNCIEVIGKRAFSNIDVSIVSLPKTVNSVERSSFCGVSELIVYDTIDKNAVEATDWKYDAWNGTVNSALACALLSVPQNYVECQANTGWQSYRITVRSADTDAIKYCIFCDSEESEDYRAMMFSAWGKNASFKFNEYDEYFIKTRNPYGRAEMAFCRIQYPYGLSRKNRNNYEAFLERCMFIERSARRITEIIAREDSVARMEILVQYRAIDLHNIEWIREELSDKKAKKCLAYLESVFQNEVV